MAVRKEEVRVTADVSNFVSKMATAGAAASGFAHRLEEADGRMANLVQTGLALAPALVPLGAAAVPAIAGLSTQLGVAALAAGTAVLAFQGVGDAVKALDAFKLAPTAENFSKLQQAMDKLGPAGQEFSLFVDNLRPKLQKLQNAAEQGLLPGVEDGIRTLLPLLPRVQEVIFSLSSTMGTLTREGARNLATPQWQAFFGYIQGTAAPVLMELGQTVGNLSTGFVAMWQAFDPLSRGFSTGLLDMSRSFAQWADGLSQTQGFQNFLNYVQKSGPQALEALGAIADALLQIVEAAAPIGSVALPAITAVAHAVSALADSSVGPTIIATAAAVGVLGRSLSLLKTVGLRGGTGEGFIDRAYVAPAKRLLPAMREASAASREFAAAQKETATARGLFAANPASVSGYTAALQREALATEKVGIAERNRGVAVRESAAAFGKGAAAAAGLAIATSGIADGMGLSNTASLALMGTLLGPWGSAVGGSVGLVKDLASANNDLESAITAAHRAMGAQAIDFTVQTTSLKALRSANDDYFRSIQGGSPVSALRSFTDLFTHSSKEGAEAVTEQNAAYLRLRQNATEVYADLNHGSLALLQATDETATAFVQKVTPALTQAGIKVKDFFDSTAGSQTRKAGVSAIRSYFDGLNSASGKSKAVASALADLGSQMQSDVTAASALKAAMDSLFGVELSQSAATDAWTQNLRDLEKEIKGTNGAINGTSNAALKNREAIRGSVQALEDKVNADAAAGVSGGRLVSTLIKGRDAIIRQATAAGASRKAVAGYLAQLNLTPKNIATIITQPGMLSAKQQVQALGKLYGLTPKQVRTLISQPGMGTSRAAIEGLAKQYHLTPKQVVTLLKAVDEASATAARVRGIYAGIPRNITTSIVTSHIDKFERQAGGPKIATGGLLVGPGTGTSDSIPAYLSNGEYVIRAAAVAKYGTHLFDRLNAMHFAGGGSVSSSGGGGSDRQLRGASHELAHFRSELSGASNRLKDLRSAAKDFRTSIVESFSHDIFGNGLSGALTQLQADRNDANSMKAALARARHLGLSANSGAFKALAASGDLGTAQDINTRAEARAFQSAFAARTAATSGLASAQSVAVYGRAISAQTRELAHLRGAVNHLNGELKHLRKETGKNVRAGARAGVADQNRKVSQRRRAGR